MREQVLKVSGRKIFQGVERTGAKAISRDCAGRAGGTAGRLAQLRLSGRAGEQMC